MSDRIISAKRPFFRRIIILAKRILPYGLRLFLRKCNWRRLYWQQIIFGHGQKPVYCPIAGKPFKRFIMQGRSEISPTNGARDRQRLEYLFIAKETDMLVRPCKLLHIAPEYCLMRKFRTFKNIEYHPADKMVTGYGRQSGVENVDLTAIPYPDGYFDFVICNHVLEHIPDDGKAMSEMWRALQPSGKAIITVPIDEQLQSTHEDASVTTPAERQKHFGQWDHVRMYAPDIKQRLEKAGFSVELIRYCERFSEDDYRKYGLGRDLLIVATKS